ncbi:hypothetical protein [Parasedimentitalea denitrificans]|nr:hypothetical protein [Sedimentitalea sp. CY04]
MNFLAKLAAATLIALPGILAAEYPNIVAGSSEGLKGFFMNWTPTSN